jgi:hypothetical protein
MMIYKKIPILFILLSVSINAFAQDEVSRRFIGGENGLRHSEAYDLGKYNIVQYRANVRTEPTTDSEVIAILSLHDEIEILENSWIEEKINGVWSFWYRIKYGNIIGYTYGGNIANITFVTDIGNNGINDYFYVRYSGLGSYRINPLNDDIVIYIDNQRISTTALKTPEFYLYPYAFYACQIFGGGDVAGNYVLIVLRDTGGDRGYWHRYYFQVNLLGRIEYIGMSAW